MNIYQTVTDRILDHLAAGVIPWKKTWTTRLPKSLTTGKEYRGVNILVLSLAGFSSRYWITYREAQRIGGHVRRGEKATPVIYWKWRTPQELLKIREELGKPSLPPCVPFINSVFNLDQVEGVARPEDEATPRSENPIELAEKVFEVMPDKPEIAHATTGEPAYSVMSDRITLPHLSQFDSATEYYATLFHELVHSTGHQKRLDRFKATKGNRSERYSFEELVAEFGAAFLCAFAGIANPTSEALQASYIDGWSKAIRQDQRLIIRAASAAQRASDYIRGKISPQIAPDDPGTLDPASGMASIPTATADASLPELKAA